MAHPPPRAKVGISKKSWNFQEKLDFPCKSMKIHGNSMKLHEKPMRNQGFFLAGGEGSMFWRALAVEIYPRTPKNMKIMS